MQDRQHLYSEAIYRINSELQSIADLHKDVFGDESIQLVPCSFDRRLRCFRWLSVHKKSWDWKDWTEELLNDCKKALENLLGQDDATTLLGKWEKDGQSASIVELAKQWPEPLVEKSPRCWDFGGLPLRWIEIRDQPQLAGFDPDGSCHRALLDLVAGRAINARQYIEGLVFRLVEKASSHERVKFVTSKLLDGFNKANYRPACFKCYRYDKSDPDPSRYYSQDDGQIFADEQALIAHFDSVQAVSNDGFGAWAVTLQNAMMRLRERDQLQHFITIPIYDGGTLSDPWGRLVGIVHAMAYRKVTDLECEKIANYIIGYSDRLLVAFRATARAQVAAAPVTHESHSESGLAIQQFLRLLPYFQDWERVSVRRATGVSNSEIECWHHYERHEPEGTFIGWKRCDQLDCHGCSTKHLLTTEQRGSDLDRRFVTLKEDLSVLLQMPWVSDRELEDIGNLHFIFELPRYAATPVDREKWERLCRQYLHEQIDAFRLLVPKVQAHRHAIRTAAVAIMSRNMSHNLGSHVLSAAATNASLDKGVPERERIARRSGLFHYLQERMDFLAEAATAGSFMSVPSSFAKMVNTFGDQTLLQQTISGTGEEASVEKVGTDDFLFASPGGRHGSHAFYIIFENLLRNAAKHAAKTDQSEDDQDLILFGRMDEATEYPDFLRVRVWDLRGNGGVERPDGRKLYSYLNDVIERHSIIDHHGKLRDGNWGIRELTIAAAYLRQVRLEDLESFAPGPALLRTLLVDDNGDVDRRPAENLCYEFFVHRAKTALIVDRMLSRLAEGQERELQRNGVEMTSGLGSYIGPVQHSYLICNDEHDVDITVDLPVRRIGLDSERAASSLERPVILRESFENTFKDGNAVGLRLWKQVAQVWKDYVCRRHHINQVQLYHGPKPFGARPCGDRAPDGAESLSSESEAVIFDRHGDLVAYWGGYERLSRVIFWESYGEADDQCTLFENAPDNVEAKQALEAQFLSAGLARLAILDERVQEAIDSHEGTTNNGVHVSMRDAVKHRRIYVPSREECDLKYGPDREKIERFLVHIRNDGPIDFVVIHQGILDRLPATELDNRKPLEWIKEITLGTNSKPTALRTELVICSGRGAPSEVLKAGVRFVPFSALLRWAVHRPSKYHLYELLCASRRPRHG